LTAANTAGLNPTIRSLLLGTVTLTPRDVTLAAAGNINTTFSTSAQRGLQSLSLATTAVPAASLALPALTSLTLVAPTSTQQLQLTAGSFVGLAAINKLVISNITTMAWPYFAFLTAIPTLASLDLPVSGNAIATVDEHDFDTAQSLRRLSLADTTLK